MNIPTNTAYNDSLIPVLIPLARMVRVVCGARMGVRNRIDFELRQIGRRRLVCGLVLSGAVRRY